MRRARALVLRTAGTNCDGETVAALEAAGADCELLHVRRLIAEPSRLERHDLFVVPGGFSYGDDVAAGRLLGCELRLHLAAPLRAFVDAGGVGLGVCNGFQVLVDTGLLEDPSRAHSERTLALTQNASARFECRWVTLRNEASRCPWLPPGEEWPVPVANAEGRLLLRDARRLEELRADGRIALTYVASGATGPTGDDGAVPYPDDPCGSVAAIAGICDATGRVLGLMPHPERNVTPWHHPRWTRLPARAEGEGLSFYRRMVQSALESRGSSESRSSARASTVHVPRST